MSTKKRGRRSPASRSPAASPAAISCAKFWPRFKSPSRTPRIGRRPRPGCRRYRLGRHRNSPPLDAKTSTLRTRSVTPSRTRAFPPHPSNRTVPGSISTDKRDSTSTHVWLACRPRAGPACQSLRAIPERVKALQTNDDRTAHRNQTARLKASRHRGPDEMPFSRHTQVFRPAQGLACAVGSQSDLAERIELLTAAPNVRICAIFRPADDRTCDNPTSV